MNPREAFRNRLKDSRTSTRSGNASELSASPANFKDANDRFSNSGQNSENRDKSGVSNLSRSPNFSISPGSSRSYHTAHSEHFMSGALNDEMKSDSASRHRQSSMGGKIKESSRISSTYADAFPEQVRDSYKAPYVETVSDFSGTVKLRPPPGLQSYRETVNHKNKTAQADHGPVSDLASEYASPAIDNSDNSGNSSTGRPKSKQTSVKSSDSYHTVQEYASSQPGKVTSSRRDQPFTSNSEAILSQETLITERGLGNMTRTYVEGMTSEARRSRESMITNQIDRSRAEIATEYARLIGDMNRTHLEGMEESEETDEQEIGRKRWYKRMKE